MREKLFLLTAASALLIDQLSKFLVRHFVWGGGIHLLSFFSIINARNTGALFGVFRGNALMLAWLGVMAAGLLLYLYRDAKSTETSVFYALILSGLLGNVIDRFALGAVTDFIRIGPWPAFNLADMAVTAGVIGIIISYAKKKFTSSSSF